MNKRRDFLTGSFFDGNKKNKEDNNMIASVIKFLMTIGAPSLVIGLLGTLTAVYAGLGLTVLVA